MLSIAVNSINHNMILKELKVFAFFYLMTNPCEVCIYIYNVNFANSLKTFNTNHFDCLIVEFAMEINNILRTLLVSIKCMCKRLRNRKKKEPHSGFCFLFRGEFN